MYVMLMMPQPVLHWMMYCHGSLSCFQLVHPMVTILNLGNVFLSSACDLFKGYGVNVTTSHRLLGGVIGNETGSVNYVKDCVSEWVRILERLIVIAETQPQLSYSAYTRSIQSQWTYLQRVTPDCSEPFGPVEMVIKEKLLPTLFGCEISDSERTLFSLPSRMGGLNILQPPTTADMNYSNSRKLTTPIINALKENGQSDMDKFIEHHEAAIKEIIRTKEADMLKLFDDMSTRIDQQQYCAVCRAKDDKMSSWLTVNPVAKHHFDLTAQEFRDALAIRYRKPLLEIPPHCDGCNAPFDLSHALSCRKGGLVTQRHNEVRDAFGDLASLAFTQVTNEPVVRETHNSLGNPALVADLSVRGVWMPQSEALFDIRVIDTDAQSYSNRSPSEVLLAAEKEK